MPSLLPAGRRLPRAFQQSCRYFASSRRSRAQQDSEGQDADGNTRAAGAAARPWAATGRRPVLDFQHILKAPALYEQNCIDRNQPDVAGNAQKIFDLNQDRVRVQKDAEASRREAKLFQSEMKRLGLKAQSAPPSDPSHVELRQAQALARSGKAALEAYAAREAALQDDMLELALALPNLSSAHTPREVEVVEISEPSDARLRYLSDASSAYNPQAVPHTDIGLDLQLLDFSAAAKTSGWGWYFLKGAAALLEQALVQYALTRLAARGFTIVTPPSMVYEHIATACGFMPRDQNGEQQIYHIAKPPKHDAKRPMVLAGTAEIPIAGMYADYEFSLHELPLKVGAVSRCYRAEAGARGADTKGLFRVHEFTKVEMFAWTAPERRYAGEGVFDANGAERETSSVLFSEMLDIQKELIGSLGLAYRVIEMPADDLGAPASRKCDIEVFFPSRTAINGGWGEVTSTSQCTDYQSRRLLTRVKPDKRDARDAGARFAHTLNGTAMAVPRVLAAIMETHYNAAAGTLRIPTVLQPWMGGQASIDGPTMKKQ